MKTIALITAIEKLKLSSKAGVGADRTRTQIVVDFIPSAPNSSSPFADMRGHHVAVRTPDLETVKRWYVEKLDFRVIAEWDYADEKLAYIAPPTDDHFFIEILGGGDPTPSDVRPYTDLGDSRYEGSSRKFDIAPGDLVVTSMAEDYRLEMLAGHEALILIFDPADDPKWPELARDALTTPIARQAGIMTAAGGIRALLSAPEDRTGEFAARTMIDLALRSTRQPDREDGSGQSPLLARAALHVLRNLADSTYGPERLARDMGMSRRSLYMRLAAFGTTPGGLIRRTRLNRVREDILQDRTRSLLDIALANGFGDGASLSRAFRIAYGHPPRELRRVS